jgi:glutamate synthase (NADPH/NADH) large chain
MVALDKVLPEAEQPADGMRHRNQTDEAQLKQMIEQHARLSGSARARELLADWATTRSKFVKVFPHEYRRALKELAAAQLKEAA